MWSCVRGWCVGRRWLRWQWKEVELEQFGERLGEQFLSSGRGAAGRVDGA
jgi:hypothetical protein